MSTYRDYQHSTVKMIGSGWWWWLGWTFSPCKYSDNDGDLFRFIWRWICGFQIISIDCFAPQLFHYKCVLFSEDNNTQMKGMNTKFLIRQADGSFTFCKTSLIEFRWDFITSFIQPSSFSKCNISSFNVLHTWESYRVGWKCTHFLLAILTG